MEPTADAPNSAGADAQADQGKEFRRARQRIGLKIDFRDGNPGKKLDGDQQVPQQSPHPRAPLTPAD